MLKLPARLLTAVATLLALMLAAQLYAQDIPDRWMPEPSKPPKIPIQPPVREPPIRLPKPIAVEFVGYISAVVIDPADQLRIPGRTEYNFQTTDGRFYRLELGGAKFYLCSPRGLIDYVGTGKLVVVKGYLRPVLVLPYTRGYGDYVLFATEVRDPAYPHCR
jgi:hypothetical protein